MNRRHFWGGVAAGAFASAGVALIEPHSVPQEKKRFAEIPAAERRRNRFLNTILRTQEGEEVRLYDDLIKDRTVLINFMYTNCIGEATCPLMTANLVRVQKALGPRVGRTIFMYSITLDPEHDTPGVLKQYARAFGVQRGWLFLTGNRDTIEAVRRNLGFAYSDPVIDQDRTQHIGMVKYGIERLERWAGCAALSKPETIVRNVFRMEPKRGRAYG